MVNIDYTSSNIAGANVEVISTLKPNYKYTFTFDPIKHLKSGGSESALLFTSNVQGPAETDFIAPSDNVYADIELVRNGNDVDVNLLGLDYQNYTGYIYDFDFKAYNNLALTSEVGSLSFINITRNTTDTKTLSTSNDIANVANYFRVQSFNNKTADVPVYANRAAKESGTELTQRVYDIRGLAYMRDLDFTSLTEGQVLDDVVPGGETVHSEVRVSADGTRMIVAEFTSAHIKVHKYRLKNGDWEKTGTDEIIEGGSELYRYSDNFLVTSVLDRSVSTYGAVAFSQYGDKYVVSNGNNGTCRLRNFDDNTEIYNFDFGNPAHCITMSADGTILLVSGNHATGHTDNSLSGPNTGGTAKIYNVNDGSVSETANLSSDQIESFDLNMYYGSDSVISGDGRTVVVIGTIPGNNKFFVWKFNRFTGAWENIAAIDDAEVGTPDYPCALSHDGKVFLICNGNSDPPARIYTTEDYLTWNESIITNDPVYAVDVSGDGKTVLLASASRLYFYTYNGSSWTKQVDNTYSPPLDGNSRVRSCALSYDGSTACFQDEYFHNTRTVRFDKNVAINTVYDYFALKSEPYFRYTYEFDYNTGIGTPTWNIQEPLTIGIHDMDTANESAYYGHWDSTSISADGRFVLVGAPMEKKAYLYDTNLNEVAYTFPPAESPSVSSYFGLRCSMDDLAKHVVVVAHTNIYFYERSAEGFTERGNVAHGYGSSVFQLKMSKDGSTVILTSSLSSEEIKKWDLSNWSWTTVPGSSELSSIKDDSDPDDVIYYRVSAIDLSYDGQYIVAGQQTGGTTGDLAVFYPGGNQTTTVSTGTPSNQLFMHSVAISSVPNASGEYTIITGEAASYGTAMTSAYFHIFKFNKTNNTLSAGISDSVFGLSKARYGRTAAMSYDGNFALLSGTIEDNSDDFHKGGAVLVDTSTRDKIKNLYEPTTAIAGSSVSSLEPRYNGYGSSCRITSDNNHILVGGGGYAFKYTAMNVKNLYFPLTTNGTSSDGVFTFSAGGSYDSDGLTLGAGDSVSIDLNDNFKFSNTAGFMFSFEARSNTFSNDNNLRIKVDESFEVGITSYQSPQNTYQSFVNIQDYVHISTSKNSVNFQTSYNYLNFLFSFNYDNNINLNINKSSVDVVENTTTNIAPLGATGFKPFSNQSVLTIESDHGASIKNLRMFAYD